MMIKGRFRQRRIMEGNMKRFALIIAFGAIVTGAFLLPALAQHGGATKLPVVTLQGKVLAVNAQQHTASVVFFVHAPSTEAPGAVPEEIARHIKKMTVRLTNELLRRKPRLLLIIQMRNWVKNARHWREIPCTILEDQHIPIVGVKRQPLATVPPGTRVRFLASVDGILPVNQLPEAVDLNSDLTQVREKAADKFTRLPDAKRSEKSLFQMVGTVTNSAPLTVQIAGQSVVVNENALAQHQFVQPQPGTITQLNPGDNIFVRAQMASWSQVSQVKRIFVALNGRQSLLPGDDRE